MGNIHDRLSDLVASQFDDCAITFEAMAPIASSYDWGAVVFVEPKDDRETMSCIVLFDVEELDDLPSLAARIQGEARKVLERSDETVHQ